MISTQKIQILLSTYNGEKYLREQLDSFLNLDNYENVKVLIRDDGSTDNTINILKEYRQKYGFEVYFGKNLGVNESFLWLFNHCDMTCDFYALSDQDDVWLSNKFILYFEKIKNGYNPEIAYMFSSCSAITDANLIVKGKTIVPKKGVGFYNAIMQNICPGHTQLINKKLLFIIQKSLSVKETSVIDHWIYLLASAFGQIYFINENTVLHRQHDNNCVGYNINFFIKNFNRIKKLNLKRSDIMTQQINYLLQLFENDLPKEYKLELTNFLDNSNFSKRCRYILKTKAYRQTNMETIIFKLLYIIGKYHL